MIRIIIPALAVLVVACASTPERGGGYPYTGPTPAVRPPPTTYTPAGAGAPERGQPGSTGRAVPHNNEGRELPPERTPGVWASTGPRRGVAISPGRATRAVTRTPSGIPDKAWRRCWSEIQQCMNELAFLSTLPDDDFECLRWLNLNACGGQANGRAEAPGSPWYEWLRKTYGTGWNTHDFYGYTQEQRAKVCVDARRERALHEAYSRIYELCQPRWSKAFAP